MESITRIAQTLASYCFILCSLNSFGITHKRVVDIQEQRTVTANLLIRTGKQYIGLQELTGHNDHPQIQKWLLQTHLKGRFAWCAASQTGIHNEANIPNPESARVVDWFKTNVVWKKQRGSFPEFANKKGMVGAIYYRKLGRYGHIVLIIGEDHNDFYTLEGNTSPPSGNAGENVIREGEGFYKKVRSKKYIAALADYCVNPTDFNTLYKNYLIRQTQ